VQSAILNGETLFAKIGCAGCHIPSLPLNNSTYTEPNPYNPAGNLRPSGAVTFKMNLADRSLPRPRLMAVNGVVHVPAYTDFKLHAVDRVIPTWRRSIRISPPARRHSSPGIDISSPSGYGA
jgi:hypothetical protein